MSKEKEEGEGKGAKYWAKGGKLPPSPLSLLPFDLPKRYNAASWWLFGYLRDLPDKRGKRKACPYIYFTLRLGSFHANF